ncbi:MULTISPECIES: hypothetical protein [unclassified Streptomyces]|uniref:hypothetical protein n=1 Tax=unclassified Streptomyces TaxID=2593676 RepID=UPI00131C2514|nr:MULTISPECIES: hypothetical protein [unclassified Streptomyces]
MPVDLGVQTGDAAHPEIVGRIAQGPVQVEPEAVGDQGSGAVVPEVDRADGGCDEAGPVQGR